jgi:hypothetical protein
MHTLIAPSFIKTFVAYSSPIMAKATPAFLHFAAILAQASDFDSGASSALSTVMKIGFLIGVVVIAGGGMAIRGGRAEEGKMAIVGGLIIAGAPAILKALYTAFGLGGSSVSL